MLAWWAGVNNIELVSMQFDEIERICEVERERIMRLRAIIHSYHVKPCTTVADSGPSSPAEQVK